MKQIISFLFVSFFFSLLATAQEHQLVKLWETDSVFKVPESVLYDESGKVMYVANIEGDQPWEKDGKGFISRLSPAGKILDLQWVSGLNAPKGMGIYKNRLYVADLTEIVIIDIKEGKVVEKVPVEGAQGLNDISISSDGTVYVSDSRAKKILTYKNGKLETYLQNLNGPNGVLATGNQFLIVDNGGLFKVGADKSLTLLADGMEGGTDGIEHVKGDDYLVSCWGGAIWYISGKDNKQLLLDTRELKINSADIGYDAKNRIVYVPTFWKNSVVAYSLK